MIKIIEYDSKTADTIRSMFGELECLRNTFDSCQSQFISYFQHRLYERYLFTLHNCFESNIDETDGDYRPMVWPVKYPYWCTGENDTDFCLVAYVDSIEDLMKQWPEAHDIDDEEVEKVEFTGRFQKPDWYIETEKK